MIDKLDNAFRFQQDALRLLTQRQDILASNIANVDTPGYLARDIDFSQQLKTAVDRSAHEKGSLSLGLTSGAHIAGMKSRMNDSQLLYRIPDQPSADGNTVDMDRERINFADNSMKYQSSLTILSTQIKSMMAVIN
ncbi:flagellar basal body rod protein FlgB [Yersinia bercovieri]|uniref:flagellar basal body rod protein FlgB n=1 Tax=Yersinia bercovieri TaxID=634 RepID=UPI0011A6DC5B|nr:flagellar basal body rod protein FlgB [Yersinia bercovieri]